MNAFIKPWNKPCTPHGDWDFERLCSLLIQLTQLTSQVYDRDICVKDGKQRTVEVAPLVWESEVMWALSYHAWIKLFGWCQGKEHYKHWSQNSRTHMHRGGHLPTHRGVGWGAPSPLSSSWGLGLQAWVSTSISCSTQRLDPRVSRHPRP